MRADRLLTILSLLQSRVKLSSKELAEELEVSERTIHRDMEALGASGIPVYAERGHLGGWALPDGYRNRLTGMTTEEISALLFLQSSSVVEDLGLSGGARSALRKLVSALPPAARQDATIARERLHVDGAGWRARDPLASGEPTLATVQEAVWAGRKLRISYGRTESDEEKFRLVCPLGLVVKQSVWYVMALAGEDNEIRTYRISRIGEATVSTETFERPEGFDLAAAWERSVARFQSTLPRYDAKVRVAVASWDMFKAERFVKAGRPSVASDGWVEADAEFNTLESACRIVLAYGRQAEAIAPAEFREAVASESRSIAALYEKS